MRTFINEIKKTIIFLGKATQTGLHIPCATGFLIGFGVKNMCHLVTAKHVVYDSKSGFIDDNMSVFFNLKDGEIGAYSINEIKSKFAIKWIFHENEDVDVAMIPLGFHSQTADVKTIPENQFSDISRLFEICDVFFLSFQPGIKLLKRISPIIRNGTISLINDDRTFYIDAFAFPGNSGSPVFIKPSPMRSEEKRISIGTDQLGGKFIGIIGEYLPYEEVAISTQTGRPRVVFEENTGLSKVWSAAFLTEIMESKIFREQVNRLEETFSQSQLVPMFHATICSE